MGLKPTISEFPFWIKNVLKKWVWLLGLLPIIIDYGSAYVPAFPDIELSWRWIVILGGVGLFISAFLVHIDLRKQLSKYEYHEPVYEVEVIDLDARLCTQDQIHVECAVPIRNQTPWPGRLVRISVSSAELPQGITSVVLETTNYRPLDFLHENHLRLPQEITAAGIEIRPTIHYHIQHPLAEYKRDSWSDWTMDLQLVIGYSTQPIGYVEKLIEISHEMHLEHLFDEAMSVGAPNES